LTEYATTWPDCRPTTITSPAMVGDAIALAGSAMLQRTVDGRFCDWETGALTDVKMSRRAMIAVTFAL
jgi:hypothetical protein